MDRDSRITARDLTWRPTGYKLWHDGSATRIHETAQNLTRKTLNNATAEAQAGTRLEPSR
jgi:hypothetical protein